MGSKIYDNFDEIKKDLKTSEESSIIYYLSPKEKDIYRSIIHNICSNDYGYLDIDLYDFKLIQDAFKENNEKYNTYLMRKYLYDRIIMRLKCNRVDRSTFDEKNIDRVKGRELQTLVSELDEAAKNFPKEKARLHIFIDSVESELLQIAINDLIASKEIMTRVYTTESLVTKETSGKRELLSPLDYRCNVSYERSWWDKDEYQRKRY